MPDRTPTSQPGSIGPAVLRLWSQPLPWCRSLLGFELERDLDPCPVGPHLPVLDRHVELDDLGDAEIPQGLGRRLDGHGRRPFPRLAAGPDDLGDPVDAVGHGFPLRFLGYLPRTLDLPAAHQHVARRPGRATQRARSTSGTRGFPRGLAVGAPWRRLCAFDPPCTPVSLRTKSRTPSEARNFGACRTLVPCSNPWASLMSVGSSHCLPMKLMPTGSSSNTKPAGTVTFGKPATAAGVELAVRKWSPLTRSVVHDGLPVRLMIASRSNLLMTPLMASCMSCLEVASAAL